MMKIPNSIENTIIAVIVAFIALVLFNQLKFIPMKKQFKDQIEKQESLIKDLSSIEKYKIENNFDKTKAKNGSIDINLTNTIDSINYKNNKKKRLINKLFDK